MDIIQFIVVLFQLTFLGLFVAFNPLLLVSEVAIILKSKNPIRNSIVFVLGVATPLILLAIVGSAIFNEDTRIRAPGIQVQLSPVLNIFFGVILVLIGLKLYFFPQPEKTSKKLQTSNLSAGSLYGFAFFRSALSFTSILGIVAATKIIKDVTDNYIIVLLGLLWTICVGMLPFLGMIGFSIKRPDTIQYIEQRIDPITRRSYKPIFMWGCLVLGGYLVCTGVLRLT